MQIIDDETVKRFYQHPSAKKIIKWFIPFVWSDYFTRAENYLNFLKYIMITGQQEEFYEKLNETHEIVTKDEVIDLNKISETGNKDSLDPVYQYIEDYNLINEALSKFDINRRMNRLAIYINSYDNIAYDWLDEPADYSHTRSIVYKKILGIIHVTYKDKYIYVNTQEDIAHVIASKSPDLQLIKVSDL
jgi:hypothetical protein